MKKRNLLSLFLASLLLVGCGGSSGGKGGDDSDYHYTPQDISARDVDYPTALPLITERSIQIHYHRDSNKYSGWGLWLWDPNSDDDSETDPFNYQDDFGITAYYPTSKFGPCEDGRLGFIVKKMDSWTKDVDGDRFFDFNEMIPDDNNCYHVYLYSGDFNIYSSPNKTFQDKITTAEFVDETNIKVTCTNKFINYTLYKDETPIAIGEGVNKKTLTFALPSTHPTIEFTSSYKIDVVFKASNRTLSKVISVAKLYNTSGFNSSFKYDGELGAIYTPSKTTFKVWSPVSSSIKLRIYNNGTPTSVSSTKGSDALYCDEVNMTKGEKGVFSAEVLGDLQGKYYTYVVTNGLFKNKEVVDPYAKGVGVNGLRGMIVDFSKTNPEGWNNVSPIQYNRNELTVWETHVADVTSHDSWGGSAANKRKYLGLVEEGTSYTNPSSGITVTTGFDHIKELGVNAVQLIPIFDQANNETEYKFNWGYNPLNYNALEGMYSSDPYDGYARIREFKQVVKAFNEAGINIIMDVVYNHVNGADGSNFDVLMPGYYYRYNSNGSLSNGSGCGNETASEMPMMRKFMIDSTVFWASEYKLGGFRFDLMGLHDITTMNKLTAECQKVNPDIVIYGEPWTGGSSTMPDFDNQSAKQSNASKFVGYGQFNDQMRDALIKGGMHGTDEKGWITNNNSINDNDIKCIKDGVKGTTTNATNDPNKTTNYVTCHDNYTLLDRIQKAGVSATTAEKYQMIVLANAVVFTSQGTSFMLAGEEFARTKGGNGNSYESPDSVNWLDYTRKSKHLDMFESYAALINFKQTATDLHASTGKINVETLDNGAILKYKVMSGSTEYIVIHRNGVSASSSINLNGYKVYLDTLGGLEVGSDLTNFTPSKYQTLIAVK